MAAFAEAPANNFAAPGVSRRLPRQSEVEGYNTVRPPSVTLALESLPAADRIQPSFPEKIGFSPCPPNRRFQPATAQRGRPAASLGHALRTTARNWPQVGAWPSEFVSFRQHDPGTFPSRPRRRLVAAGSSIAARWSCGAEWVTGRTVTRNAPISSSRARMMAQGRSSRPSSCPAAGSRRQREL